MLQQDIDQQMYPVATVAYLSDHKMNCQLKNPTIVMLLIVHSMLNLSVGRALPGLVNAHIAATC